MKNALITAGSNDMDGCNQNEETPRAPESSGLKTAGGSLVHAEKDENQPNGINKTVRENRCPNIAISEQVGTS